MVCEDCGKEKRGVRCHEYENSYGTLKLRHPRCMKCYLAYEDWLVSEWARVQIEERGIEKFSSYISSCIEENETIEQGGVNRKLRTLKTFRMVIGIIREHSDELADELAVHELHSRKKLLRGEHCA